MNDGRELAQSYLEPEDDGLVMRPSGSWACEKLDYLERYMHVFITSMHGKPWRGIHYIDLFAGPGKCCSKAGRIYLGSPLIALNTPYPFTCYFFADLDADNIAALKQRCSASSQRDHAHYLVGDSNIIVDKIVEHISVLDREFIRGQWPSLNLAFLDPAGLDLRWGTVEALARLNRMDLIIHYPQMGLTRYMPLAFNSEEPNRIDLFFGDREWRRIYEKWRGKRALHSQLIDHYRARLQGLGYREVLRGDETGYEPLMRSTKRKAPLYRLLFASKHPLGHDFWRKVTRRDVYGQARLL